MERTGKGGGPSSGSGLLGGVSFQLRHYSGRLKRLAGFVHRQHVRYQFARDYQRRPIAMAALELPLVDRRQLRIPPRRQLCRLDQHRLQVSIPLLGDGPPLLHVRRTDQR